MTPLNYRWAHAVNSRASLELVQRQINEHDPATATTFANAIEADIIWSEAQQVPVMGHPPAIDGDLPLVEFLNTMLHLAATVQSSTRNTPLSTFIVKLDFKTHDAFTKSFQWLQPFIAQYPFSKSILINADILAGPATYKSNVAFDATTFLQQVDNLGAFKNGHYRHKLVLSVGWTTSKDDINQEYSAEMVANMLQLLVSFDQTIPVTFPLRATNVRNSWVALRPLLARPNHGMTLWWTSSGDLSNNDLEWLYTTLELETFQDECHNNVSTYKGRTYYDIKGFETFVRQRENKRHKT